MILIAIFGAIIAIACANDGEWGSAAVTVVVALAIVLMLSEGKKDREAMMNARDYWYRGGPDRKE